MIRFTIRDVLWATAVTAFATCWYLERDGRLENRNFVRRTFQENERLKEKLRDTEIALKLAERKLRPRPSID
jgi:hypothetical protein